MLTPKQLIDIAVQCFDEPLKSEIAAGQYKSYVGYNKKCLTAGYYTNNIAKVGLYDAENNRYLSLLQIIFHGKTFEIQPQGFMCRFDTAKAVDLIRKAQEAQTK